MNAPVAEKATGPHLGKYRLVGLMASGGMARLFLACMTGVDQFTRTVLLKQVLPHLSQSKDLIEMFVNEARVAARLDHPNIVRIYDLSSIDNEYFISMEYLPGEDLTRILRRSKQMGNPVPVDLAATVIQSIADALHCAHDLTDSEGRPMGLVHRDVSLSNIIVTYHGLAKLADFGIAKATANEGTSGTTFKGKFAYASPEQVLGQPVDRRTDVFALGIVLWEILTLKRLFKRENDAATIRAVEAADIPNVREFRPDITPELEHIVMKALSRDRNDRYQTAGEMSEALDELLSRERLHCTPKTVAKWMVSTFGAEIAALKQSVSQGRGLEPSGGEHFSLSSKEAALIGLKPLPEIWQAKANSIQPQKQLLAPPPLPPAENSASSARIQPQQTHESSLAALSGVKSSQSQSGSNSAWPSSTKAAWSREAQPTWSSDLSNPGKTRLGQTTREVTRSKQPAPSDKPYSFEAPAAQLPSWVNKPAGQQLSRTKFLGLAALAGIILFLAVIAFPRASDVRPATVWVRNIPEGAQLVINGEPVSDQSPLHLPPGAYPARMMREGKLVKEFTIEIEEGEQTISLP